jgi:PAS domain S-box-containing protein
MKAGKHISINLIVAAIGFGIIYWVFESVRDIVLFQKGNLIERLFYPDWMSFWMRILVFFLLVLFGSCVQKMSNETASCRRNETKFLNDYRILLIGILFVGGYWLLESVRDTIVFGKGPLVRQLIHPYALDFWRRFLPVCMLILFSAYIQNLFDKRKHIERQLIKSRDFIMSLFERFPAMVWRTDTDSRCDYFNTTWLDFTGRLLESEIGAGWIKGVHPEDRNTCIDRYQSAFRERKSFTTEYRLLRRDGKYRWIANHGQPYFDLDGRFAGFIGTCYDQTEVKEYQNQIEKDLVVKKALLREVHHRVKNNLQVISSLLNLQMTNLQDNKQEGFFINIQSRIRAIALVHEQLCESEDINQIRMDEYVQELVRNLVLTYARETQKIAMTMNLDPISLDIDIAIPCGLVFNELISNAFKYAFPPMRRKDGKVTVSMKKIEESDVELIIQDNGIGLPENFDIDQSTSLGLKLVHILVEDQLDGKINIVRENGTRIEITIKS